MKNIICTIVLIFFAVSNGICQIEYDFATGKFNRRNMGPYEAGSMVYVKVKNINTFRYQVKIKGEQIEYVTPVPSELQALFRLSDPTKKVSEAEAGITETKEAVKQMDDAEKKVPIAASGSPLSVLKTELNNLVSLCNSFLGSAQKVRKIKFRRSQLISLAKNKWLDHGKLSTAKSALGADCTVPSMETDFHDFFDQYANVEAQYKIARTAALAAGTTGIAVEKRIEEAEKKVENAYTKINEDDYIKLIEDVNVLQINLNDSKNFEFVSPSVQAEGDYLSFDLKIEPDQTNLLSPYENVTETNLEIPVKGGWKADFSVGPAFSFGGGAKDHKFSFSPTSDSDKDQLEQGDDKSDIRPGIAAMIHAYPRLGTNVAIGGMMGVGAGFKAENAITATYYLGLSAILGKAQKIVVSIGASFIPVDRLKSNYKVGNTYSTEDVKITDVTEKYTKASAFFAISYNITNRVKR